MLIALTVGSFLVAEELHVRTVAITAIFLIAAIKAELVIDHFMEARTAKGPWLVLYMGWVTGVTLLLVWGHGW